MLLRLSILNGWSGKNNNNKCYTSKHTYYTDYLLVITQIPKAGVIRDPRIRWVHRNEHWIIVMVFFSSQNVPTKRHPNMLWSCHTYMTDQKPHPFSCHFKWQAFTVLLYLLEGDTTGVICHRSKRSTSAPGKREAWVHVLNLLLNIHQFHSVRKLEQNQPEFRSSCSTMPKGMTMNLLMSEWREAGTMGGLTNSHKTRMPQHRR